MPANRRRPGLDLPEHDARIDTGVVRLERDPDRRSGVTVMVNDVESSYLDLEDPSHLEFEYMQQIAAVLDVVKGEAEPLRAVHLGGAGCALPRAIDAMRPGSRQLVVEIDAELARLARAWFDLPRAPRLRIRSADARAAVSGLKPAGVDVVVRDVFSGRGVPVHLRSVEFLDEVLRALAPGGLYLANGADSPPLAETRREVATVGCVFRHVALLVEPAILRGRRYGNVVVVGSTDALPVRQLTRALLSLPIPVRLLVGDELEAFAGRARPIRDPTPADPALARTAPETTSALPPGAGGPM